MGSGEISEVVAGDRKGVYSGQCNPNGSAFIFRLLDFTGVEEGGIVEVSRHWRLKQQRYSLVGEICPHCQQKIFPPRDICPNPECGGGTLNNNLNMVVRMSVGGNTSYDGGKEIMIKGTRRMTRVDINKIFDN